MGVGDYIRVQAALCCVSVPRLLFALSFHSKLLSWNLLENIKGVTGLHRHTLQMNKEAKRC